MKGRIKDNNKLLIIAETYFYLKGPFTAAQLYDFLLAYNFKFYGSFSKKRIGFQLQRSGKFKRIDTKPSTYEVIE